MRGQVVERAQVAPVPDVSKPAMRDLVSTRDLSASEVRSVLDLAAVVKARPSDFRRTLEGKQLVMFFEKPSLRTRLTFEAGMASLGGTAFFMDQTGGRIDARESLHDIAHNVERWVDVIVLRTFAHSTVEDMAAHASIPVINALSDLEHPTQIISDLFTIQEAKGKLKGLKIAYIGDGNNVCNSLILGAAQEGMKISVASPDGYEPKSSILKYAEETGESTGASIKVVRSATEAAEGADVLYTDVWVSMGDESTKEKRMRDFEGYQINSDLLRVAKKDASVMHCLPAHRGLEITDDVIEGKQSIVWQQGENKLYGAAAVLEWLLAKK
jgi:ornithine carbamoyltransferase